MPSTEDLTRQFEAAAKQFWAREAERTPLPTTRAELRTFCEQLEVGLLASREDLPRPRLTLIQGGQLSNNGQPGGEDVA